METLKDYLPLYIGCEMMYATHHEPPRYILSVDNLKDAIEFGDAPLLRIFPSMTDQEKEFIYDFIFPANIALVTPGGKITFIDSLLTDRCYPTDEFILYENIGESMTFYDNCKLINRMLKMHFDLFGLIEKGLVLDLNKQL